MENKISGEHHKIGPTADLVSYWREFSDIPYANEISKLANAKQVAENIFKNNLPNLPSEAITKILNTFTQNFGKVFIEGRYKCLNQQIKRVGIKQIYEAASGICPRCINITQDSSVKYVATDLPERLSGNKGLLKQVMKNHMITRPNLYFSPINVLDKKSFIDGAKPLGKGPVAFIHEGLLPYFPQREKQIFGENVRSLLEKTGGVWITPDIMYKDAIQKRMDTKSPQEREMSLLFLSAVSGVSGRDLLYNAFETETHADKFFKDLGFSIEKYSMYDGSYESSVLKNLPEDAKNNALGALKSGHIYVARLK